MNDQNPHPTTQTSEKATPLKCLIGSVISSGLTFAVYSMMTAIVTSFAHKPILSHNQMVANITAAVRTLVVGTAALGTGIFGLVAIGLLALAVQLSFQSTKSTS